MNSDIQKTIRCAVVTGRNKGIGFEICKQLASVVLTTKDVTRGLEAVENLKISFGITNVVFHELDVMNPITIFSLADFVQNHYGKLDILVNNDGISGIITDSAGFMVMVQALGEDKNKEKPNLKQMVQQTYESAVECLQTNYFGVKSVTKTLIPLLQLCDSVRIVNVSSRGGKLKGLITHISNKKVLQMLSDGDGLTKDKVDESMNIFFHDLKEDSLVTKGRPSYIPAYKISKVCLNSYTRILAREFPTFRINCVCPSRVKTDINYNTGFLTTAEGAETIVNLAFVLDDGPSGLYFTNGEVTPF
ncbi:salutaridine reductase-like [Papaver somniferum]|uniref:salutaridine reductase-like n=1 Tax=Papaver somniferum TaxID=3469 RepID=UPI000E6F6EF4|nr:salutaridine reductase-like [Papaver somniferum]